MKMKATLSLTMVIFITFNVTAQERISATLDKQLFVPAITKASPRLWYSTERLAFLRNAYQQKTEPYYKAITKVIAQASKGLKDTPKPYIETEQPVFLRSASDDGKLAVCMALAFHITGDIAFQQKAVEILLVYAKEVPNGLPDKLDMNKNFPDIGLAAYSGTSGMVLTYDLLLSTKAFTEENKATMKAWFRKLVKVYEMEIDHWNSAYIQKDGIWVKSTNPKDLPYFGGQYYQNHVAENLMGILEIGYALGDSKLVQYCLDSKDNPRDLKTMISGAIHITGDTNQYVYNDTSVITRVGTKYHRDLSKNNWNKIPPETGEMYDRYRTIQGAGIGYGLLCFKLLLQASELAWQNGIDFYHFTGKNGQNLLLPFQYYADFAITADCTIKSGYYVWSTIDQNESLGQDLEVWELGAVRYPEQTELFKSVLTSKYYKRGNVSLYNIHNPLLSWFLVAGSK